MDRWLNNIQLKSDMYYNLTLIKMFLTNSQDN